jgi:hypothetical protein
MTMLVRFCRIFSDLTKKILLFWAIFVSQMRQIYIRMRLVTDRTLEYAEQKNFHEEAQLN